MSDILQKPWVQKVIKLFGLPVSIPQPLLRQTTAISEQDLGSKVILMGGTEGALLKESLSKTLHESGALLTNSATAYNALIFDATNVQTVGDLKEIYQFFHKHIKQVIKNGRIIILSRLSEDADSITQQTVSNGIEGFSRTMAKEVGKRNTTVQLVNISAKVIGEKTGLNKRILPVLHFLLGKQSSFITGQVIAIRSDVKAPKTHSLVQSLSGKVALVTGAARGIGAEAAKSLAREGAKVVLLDIPQMKSSLEALAGQIDGEVLCLDVTAGDVVEQVQAAVEPLGRLDILVNNAGITRDKTIAKMSEEYWDAVMAVNLQSAISLSEGLLEKGLNDGARIIGLSSISGIGGNVGQANYCTSKTGMIALAEALAPKIAKRGITINAIAPGFIETKMTAKLPFFVQQAGRRLTCLGQAGLPEDIAESITFLASSGASGISGQCLRVCGGSFLGA